VQCDIITTIMWRCTESCRVSHQLAIIPSSKLTFDNWCFLKQMEFGICDTGLVLDNVSE